MAGSDPEVRTAIYLHREEALVREHRLLAKWQGHDRNKELIRSYEQFLFVKGSGQQRVAKLVSQLRFLCDQLSKTLDVLTKNDIERLVAWINQNTAWTVVTRADYRRCLKQFYAWFEEEDSRLSGVEHRDEAVKMYQYLRKHVTSSYQRRALDYSTIITDDDAKRILEQGCKNTLERAIFAVLHETGCRVGELLNLRIRDIERKEKYAMLRLDGKTGERRVPIMQCTPYLYQWLRDHPFKDNQNSLLWVSKHAAYAGEPLHWIGVQRLLQRTYARANIKKKNNAHWLRHSRATLLASRYTEQILCALMGWTLGSKQVRTYVHLSAGQVEDAFLSNNKFAERAPAPAPVQHCVCGATNDSMTKYCYQCGNALNVASIVQRERRRQEDMVFADNALSDIIDNPHAMARLREVMTEARVKRRLE